jgi:hypothetical protein
MFVRAVPESDKNKPSQLTFACMPLIWTYSIGSEVFALNNLFVALLLRLYFWVADSVNNDQVLTRLTYASVASAIGLGNQHTLTLIILPFFAWSAVSFPSVLVSTRPALQVAVSFLVPFCTMYAAMAISAQVNPSSGSWGDLSSLSNIFQHMLRKDYGTFQLYSGDDGASGSTMTRIEAYLTDAFSLQMPTAIGIVCVVGMLCIGKLAFGKFVLPTQLSSPTSNKNDSEPLKRLHPGPVLLTVLLAWLFYVFVFHRLANLPLDNALYFAIHARFWMQPTILLFVPLACGFRACSIACIQLTLHLRLHKDSLTAAVLYRVSVVATMAILGQHAIANWGVVDNSRNTFIRDYGMALLDSLPPNATLITAYDFQWTSVRYLTVCEGVRPDVDVLNGPMMTFDWFHAKRHMLHRVSFSGTHLARANSQSHRQGGFTIGDMLYLNVPVVQSGRPRTVSARLELIAKKYTSLESQGFAPRNKEKHYILSADHGGGIFHAGQVHFDSPAEYADVFEWVPHGLALKAVEKQFATTEQEFESMRAAFKSVSENYTPPPVGPPTDPSSWEYATRIDFTRVLSDLGAASMEYALGDDPNRIRSTEALLWSLSRLEESAILEPANNRPPCLRLWKNLGLGYFRFVKSKLNFEEFPLVVQPKLPHMTNESHSLSWAAFKAEASLRVLSAWEQFLRLPDSENDVAVGTIKHVVAVLSKAKLQASSK